LLELKTTLGVHHGDTENTEEIEIDLAVNLVQRGNHRMPVFSVPSVPPW
jgi:hypothetical protein